MGEIIAEWGAIKYDHDWSHPRTTARYTQKRRQDRNRFVVVDSRATTRLQSPRIRDGVGVGGGISF